MIVRGAEFFSSVAVRCATPKTKEREGIRRGRTGPQAREGGTSGHQEAATGEGEGVLKGACRGDRGGRMGRRVGRAGGAGRRRPGRADRKEEEDGEEEPARVGGGVWKGTVGKEEWQELEERLRPSLRRLPDVSHLPPPPPRPPPYHLPPGPPPLTLAGPWTGVWVL